MLVTRQEYSRALKVACMREVDSGKGMAAIERAAYDRVNLQRVCLGGNVNRHRIGYLDVDLELRARPVNFLSDILFRGSHNR